ncbi:hypothetical protein DH2020_031585 [Rehmannia glutinosa]|uniref:homogentisate 1,2-dioxygenase n=1 Tax=Rehmannia glutinosa TaxID=99300 RepID=A0ABR0VHI5_REHGL
MEEDIQVSEPVNCRSPPVVTSPIVGFTQFCFANCTVHKFLISRRIFFFFFFSFINKLAIRGILIELIEVKINYGDQKFGGAAGVSRGVEIPVRLREPLLIGGDRWSSPSRTEQPLVCPYGLYAEQISGTSFTSPRKLNQRSWLYRVKPSVTHEPFRPRVPKHGKLVSEFNESNSSATPTQLRWKPAEVPESPTDFVDGLYTVENTLDYDLVNALLSSPAVIHIADLCSFRDSSACLTVGFRFVVDLPDGPSRGYVAEIFGTHFQLPDLGPIGANGLAASRDFLVPVAWFEHISVQYDLSKFCPYNTVLMDHGDPSINTVLTAPTDRPGVALLDFVIFPPRWLVAEHTFRPPYYHRNCMSEFMGLIYGGYEAKADGFLPGGASLHSCMTPHGPDTKTYEATIALGNEAGPRPISNTMAFMFESCLMPRVCPWALESPYMDHDYYQCWIGLKSHFACEIVSEDGQDVENEHAKKK